MPNVIAEPCIAVKAKAMAFTKGQTYNPELTTARISVRFRTLLTRPGWWKRP